MSDDQLFSQILPARFVMKQGAVVVVRKLHADDTPLLVDLFDHLSIRTRYLRFFSPLTNLSHEDIAREAQRLCQLDGAREDALVAFVMGDDGAQHAVGVARFCQDAVGARVAEVALVVRDDYQRRAIGRRLFDLLAAVARARGITTFSAVVFAENYPVIHSLRASGLRYTIQTHQGESLVTIAL